MDVNPDLVAPLVFPTDNTFDALATDAAPLGPADVVNSIETDHPASSATGTRPASPSPTPGATPASDAEETCPGANGKNLTPAGAGTLRTPEREYQLMAYELATRKARQSERARRYRDKQKVALRMLQEENVGLRNQNAELNEEKAELKSLTAELRRENEALKERIEKADQERYDLKVQLAVHEYPMMDFSEFTTDC